MGFDQDMTPIIFNPIEEDSDESIISSIASTMDSVTAVRPGSRGTSPRGQMSREILEAWRIGVREGSPYLYTSSTLNGLYPINSESHSSGSNDPSTDSSSHATDSLYSTTAVAGVPTASVKRPKSLFSEELVEKWWSNVLATSSYGIPEPPFDESEGRETEDEDETSDQVTTPTITTNTPIKDAFEYLTRHGCLDLSSRLDPLGCSAQALAGGRFGDVWRGKLTDGTHVAIKCLRLHTASHGAKSIKRAARELYNWSKAKHKNVLELMGIAMFGGQLAMISLWMMNGTLSTYVFQNPGVDRWALCVQVAEGLAYMHNINMVHGDLKAINILVSDQGIAKLSDFGNSILTNCSLGFTATSNIGGGTIRWMAPELLEEDAADRSLPADIYALGMTILEVMTGRLPFSERRSDAAVSYAISSGKRPSQPVELSVSTKYGDERWKVLLSCWATNPGDRPICGNLRDTMSTLL
ncbi:kinase-like protein [Ceratobasidium sp. AG-I]|nr:kinase-like protein [Ceratobasidium sp. AG-I]